jgi:hypothetical protein
VERLVVFAGQLCLVAGTFVALMLTRCTVLFSLPLLTHPLLRFTLLDRSTSGYAMHQYGLQILTSIARYEPSHLLTDKTAAASRSASGSVEKILFSHTDLNWNTVRYLQSCEGVGSSALTSRNFSGRLPRWKSPHFPSPVVAVEAEAKTENEQQTISHLNFQLIPFPWFEKQQAPLYPTIVFPPLFKGVGTNRMSKENSLLIQRVLSANLRSDRALFLDMQVRGGSLSVSLCLSPCLCLSDDSLSLSLSISISLSHSLSLFLSLSLSLSLSAHQTAGSQ